MFNGGTMQNLIIDSAEQTRRAQQQIQEIFATMAASAAEELKRAEWEKSEEDLIP